MKLNWFLYCLSPMLQFSEFVWSLSYSVWDDFNKFLLIDATDRSKISSDQKRFFIVLSLYPLSFFANTPFKYNQKTHDVLQRYLDIFSQIVFNPLKLRTSKQLFRRHFMCSNMWDWLYINDFIFHIIDQKKSEMLLLCIGLTSRWLLGQLKL